MTLSLRKTRCAGWMDPKAAPDHDHDYESDNSDQTILAALSEQPFASIWKLL
jgi:hypothetical protein